jgi:hypothetical protein
MTARRILVIGASAAALLAVAPSARAYFGLQAEAQVPAGAAVLKKPDTLDVTLERASPAGLHARLVWTVKHGSANDAKPDGFLVERQSALVTDPWKTVGGKPQCGVDPAAGGAIRCTLVDALPGSGGTVAYRYRVSSLRGAHWQSAPTGPRLVTLIAPDAAHPAGKCSTSCGTPSGTSAPALSPLAPALVVPVPTTPASPTPAPTTPAPTTPAPVTPAPTTPAPTTPAPTTPAPTTPAPSTTAPSG